MFSKDVILGLVRHVLTFGGGILGSTGWLLQSDVELVVGSIVAIIGAVWSGIKNRKQLKSPAAE